VTANAQGEASRFKQVLVEYQKAPAVTRDRMYIDTMQKIFSSTTKVMVDAKGSNNLIYLPLDKLISQTAAGTAAATAPSAATSSTPTLPTDSVALETQLQQESRTRDSRISREREVR
jgi:membrane protease subunit HflK